MKTSEPFTREFYQQHTVEVARQLIGAFLIHTTGAGTLAGRIVETEAYRQNDPASHSYRGRTRRNLPMFSTGGIAYVYFIYGMYNCFNVVTEPEGYGSAVLIRAVEPVENTNVMWDNRFPGITFDANKSHLIADGPGKLCRAMEITREHNGADLSTSPLRVHRNLDGQAPSVQRSGRIGVKAGADFPWRFFDAESASVSRKVSAR